VLQSHGAEQAVNRLLASSNHHRGLEGGNRRGRWSSSHGARYGAHATSTRTRASEWRQPAAAAAAAARQRTKEQRRRPSFLPPRSLVGSSPLRRCSSMAADHAPGRRKRRLEDTVTAPIPEPSTCLPNERQRSSRVVAVVDRAPTAPSFAPADQGAPAHSRPAEMLADLEREAQVLRQLHQQFNEQLNRLQVRARP